MMWRALSDFLCNNQSDIVLPIWKALCLVPPEPSPRNSRMDIEIINSAKYRRRFGDARCDS